MTDKFVPMANILGEYLRSQKVFVQNPRRIAELDAATELALKMFPGADITIEGDPLQMGALFLCVKDFDITVRETKEFAELISKANNFEIRPINDDCLRLIIMFGDALVRL